MELFLCLLYGLLAAILIISLVSVYRIYLHPLASVPGPRFAAVSRFYEWYCDCIQPGTYIWKIKGWHEKYGPIVRIGPNEVHIDDPDFFDVLYGPSTKLDKDPWYYGFIADNDSAFATIEHDIHRVKRSKQNNFFSQQNVDKSAPILTGILEHMFKEFEVFRANGKPLAIKNALKSFALDVVCEYCFVSGIESVRSPDFGMAFHSGTEAFNYSIPWFRHFPILAKIVLATPEWVTPFLDQSTQAVLSFTNSIRVQVQESIRQSKSHEAVNRKTIIRDIYESDLPKEFRTKQVLEAEATTFVTAAVNTTSRFIEVCLFHILANPSIAKQLTEELRAHRPRDLRDGELLTYRDLESLPYLGAIFLETQRVAPAVPSRLPRRIPKSQMSITYGSHQLAPGTVIGMSNWDVLISEKVWGDNAQAFDPTRWLDSSPSSPVSLSSAYKSRMSKYMPAFGRGSRSCVGRNLAAAEFYVLVGNLFRKFDIELYETDIREVEIVQDCFTAMSYKGGVGVRVLLR